MDREKLKNALRNAHRAGDVEAARKIANALKNAPATPSPKQPEQQQSMASGIVDSATDGLTFGFGDEITAHEAGVLGKTPEGGWFDYSKSYGERYNDALNAERAQNQKFNEQHPVISTAANIAGGLATAGGAAKSGLTLMGRGLGTKAAVAEGAAYGGAFGAGSDHDGSRLDGALTGAVSGGAAGGVVDKVARSAPVRKVVDKIRGTPPPGAALETVEDLGQQAAQLYQKAHDLETLIKPRAIDRLIQKASGVGGRINEKLRPKTAGVIEELNSMANKPATLQEFDEMRQVVGQAMQRAEPQDLRTLTLIKEEIDALADTITPDDIIGDAGAFDLIKEARDLWHRKSKSQILQTMMDKADINTGQYTQSGIANTIGRQFRSLANNPKRLKAFSSDEQAMIREIAGGRVSPASVRWLSKFAPRGVVSAMLGVGGGTVVAGPAGLALPMAGYAAARQVDNAAMKAAKTLQDAVIRGKTGKPQETPSHPVADFLSIMGAQQSGQKAGGRESEKR